MADNKTSGEKLPLDAKEKFLRSVKKKNEGKDLVESSAKSTELKNNEKPVDDIPVLFDDIDNKNEIKQESHVETVSSKAENNKVLKESSKKKKTESKKISEKRKNLKQEKKQKSVKIKKEKVHIKDEHTYIKLPFVNLIPLFMALESVFLIIVPFMSSDRTVTFVFVTLFWISVLCSGGLMLFIKLKYKDEIDSLYDSMSPAGKIYRFVSVVNFFRNKPAKMIDIAFFATTLLMIIFVILGTKNIFDHIAVTASVLSIFLLSLNMHVFFNDSIYEYSLKFKKNKSKKEVIDNE